MTAAIAGVGWLVAAIACLRLALTYPLPGRSAWWYAVNGWAFWSADQFAPGAAGAHAWFVGGGAVFAVGVAVTMLLAAAR
jgi:hypothetical protein